MPRPSPSCHACQIPMEPGFIPDLAHGGIGQTRWIGGTPQAPKLLGLNLMGEVSFRQFNHGVHVWAYRCPDCSRLELFAFDSENE